MDKYLHGFIPEEQQRLIEQAGFLTPLIYPRIDFSGCKKILEIGCGVGAQTAKLLELYPEAHITCVDNSSAQLDKAKENLSFAADRVDFILQDATAFDLPDKYDGVYICWVLEHISDPLRVFTSLKPFLQTGVKIWITEVFNSSFYYSPKGAHLDRYYEKYNEFQLSCGGNPDIGANLGNLLSQAGLKQIKLFPDGFHLDRQEPMSLYQFIQFWKELMRSGSKGMIDAGLIREEDIRLMEVDLDHVFKDENPVFYYRFVQAYASLG